MPKKSNGGQTTALRCGVSDSTSFTKFLRLENARWLIRAHLWQHPFELHIIRRGKVSEDTSERPSKNETDSVTSRDIYVQFYAYSITCCVILYAHYKIISNSTPLISESNEEEEEKKNKSTPSFFVVSFSSSLGVAYASKQNHPTFVDYICSTIVHRIHIPSHLI